ncbi:MAG: ATP-grasp domain-containing protein [Bdellovibrionales bacterium]|nr:ATP-grasp domain-containing protein [Bdellovibrionales bacterium]
MKKRRVLVLLHKDLIPPDTVPKGYDIENASWKTEYHVIQALKKLGHEVRVTGILGDLNPIRTSIHEFNPHIVFNLLEEFDGEAVYDQNVVSYLELLKTPYTGANPRGLILARDKSLTKKILSYHRVPAPSFLVFPRNRSTRIKEVRFPQIVKCLNEEASMGISQASVVNSLEKLKDRVHYLHKTFQVDAISEDFIEGSEYYVGVLGNYALKTLPVWELKFEKSDAPKKEIYSEKAKFSDKYRNRKGIRTGPAELSELEIKEISNLAKRTYKALGLSGYARIDFRRGTDSKFYVLEANPNPDIAYDDEFAMSAQHAGISYADLISKILKLGLDWSKGP